jgi:dTDP-4-amino-4,6-dideoxygalactose transaminase
MSSSKLALLGGEPIAAELKGRTWPILEREDEIAVLQALRNDQWGGLGEANLPNNVFEREFAKYQDCKHGILVANGTLALELALRVGGVRPGDEVLVPAITFVASASAIVSVGAVPKFVDVDQNTAQINAEEIDKSAGPKTKAVVVVHYGGYMADMDKILPVAKKHNLLVVEDCAHAHGAAWRGNKSGSWGDLSGFSFQHSKTLTAGEGGITLTDREDLAERAALMRNIGRRADQKTYSHYLSASNWRLGGLQGALLLSRFKRFPKEAEARHRNILAFEPRVGKIEGLTPMPADERMSQRTCYFYVLKFDEGKFGCARHNFIAALDAEGFREIGTGYARPLYKEPAFDRENLRPMYVEGMDIPDYHSMYLPIAEMWAKSQVTIPHPYFYGDGRGVTLLLEAIQKIKDHVGELKDLRFTYTPPGPSELTPRRV